jgi:DNA-binding FadR family transcriptional regulator
MNLNNELNFGDAVQKKINKSSVSIVIDNIKKLIMLKKFIPGKKIPTENELSEIMGFSRGTIREALKILAAFGVIEIRRGDGTYISTSMKESLVEPLLFNLISSDYDINELVELREFFEIGIVDLAIKNADDDDLEMIIKACNEIKDCIDTNERDPKILLKCDLDFHSALGKATKNILVSKIYDFIMDFFSERIKVIYKEQEKIHKKY